MLRRLRHLSGSGITASNGDRVGVVRDAYFDDERWTVRYLVVQAGNWLSGRTVLISPMSVDSADWDNRDVVVGLTPHQIERAPDVDTARPVSRQWEAAYAGYFGYPYYWGGMHAWGVAATPLAARSAAAMEDAARTTAAFTPEESHLRSTAEVTGYHIEASDGSIGHVDDFLVDAERWSIERLLVDTSNWIGGRAVVVAPAHVRRIDWAGRRIVLTVTRDEVRRSPEYQPEDRDRAARPIRPI